MSRLTKTRGIVVRHAAYSETSRIIQWITEDHGKISTLAKGAMRPRNPLLGQFDQLYTCELIYYAHERESVFITREVAPLSVRPRLRSDWRGTMAGLYMADLVARIMPAHEPAPELFHLLEEALTCLDEHGWFLPVPMLFELRLLSRLGLAPRLDRCALCDRTFENGDRARFDVKQGGMVCRACRASGTFPEMGADVLAILTLWQRSTGWTIARTSRCSPEQLASVRELLGEFLGYHLDLGPRSRDMTMGLLFQTKS